MKASALVKISDQIFDIPLNLYRRMLVLYSDIKENEEEKNINLREYKCINIQFPISDKNFIWTSIGLKQYVPDWTKKGHEGFVTRNTFAFWTRSPRGAPDGQINVFDDFPLITIETEKVNEYNINRLDYKLYDFDGNKINVVLTKKFDNRELVIKKENYYPKMLRWILKNFDEVENSVGKT